LASHACATISARAFDRLHDFGIAVDFFARRFGLQQLAVDQRLQQLLAGHLFAGRLDAGAGKFVVQLHDRDFDPVDAGQRLAGCGFGLLPAASGQRQQAGHQRKSAHQHDASTACGWVAM
jgi:hypothetical protein